jgi:tetratricopeptide (TPR) repeat protein
VIAWGERNYPLAAALYEESLAIRRELGDIGGIAVSLSNLAEVKIGQREHDRARELLLESLELARELDDKQVIAYCLEGLATVAWMESAPERAATLFGAAEALREASRLPLPPPARPDYDRATAAICAALGERFSATWSHGRSLSLEQAIALALAPTGAAADPGGLSEADSCTP